METLALYGGIHEETTYNKCNFGKECGKIDVQTFNFHCIRMFVGQFRFAPKSVADKDWNAMPTN